MAPSVNQRSVRLGLWQYRKLLQFRGRSTRTELVSFWVVNLLATVALVLIHWVAPAAGIDMDRILTTEMLSIISIAITLPAWALFVRRTHDWDAPVWLGPALLLGYIALILYQKLAFGLFDPKPTPLVIGSIAYGLLLLFAALRGGTPGPNRYGPDPRVEAEQAQ